jgi:predicted acetyltransferase
VVRPGTPADLPLLHELHDRTMARANGTLVRPDSYTSRRFTAGNQPETCVVETDGVPTGFVGWDRTAHGAGFTLTVRELLADDLDTLTTLWRLVGSWHPAVASVQLVSRPVEPLAYLLPDGDPDLGVVSEQLWMLRLVDVAGALRSRGYDPTARGRLDLRVRDTSAPWNDGDLVVELDGGRATATPGGSGAVRVDVGTLAALFSGRLAPAVAAQLGRLDAGPDDLALLARAFAGPLPWMHSYF